MMPCLGLYDPWASLVAFEEKRVETRSWKRKYRGELAIYATKAFPIDAQHACLQAPFRDVLSLHRYRMEFAPRGFVLCTVKLIDIVPTDQELARQRCGWIQRMRAAGYHTWTPGLHEDAFGDYGPDRFAWLMADVRLLKTPIQVRGHQGMWHLQQHEEAAVREELES